MIAYTLRKSTRARHMRITIRPSGEVVVTAPERMSVTLVEHFMAEKRDWVEKHITKIKKRNLTELGPAIPKGTTKDLQEKKTAALLLVSGRLRHFNTVYKFSWNTVTIKNTSSRWGSCSKQKNLNFNYRIIYLPKELADYLVVHELCHLGELNHSANFWKLVEKSIPNYRDLRKRLKNIA